MDFGILGVFFATIVLVIALKARGGAGAVNSAALFPIEARIDALLKNAGVRYDANVDMPVDVLDALTRGDKIEAIKRYRVAKGVGLKEAKDVVEQTKGGYLRVQEKLDALLKSAGVQYDPSAGIQEAVTEAIRANKMIEAVKLYRAATGVGLKEAKDAVEEKKRQMGM